MSRRALALVLLLVSCGPTTHHRGEAGMYCKPDGTCISANLECVNGPVVGGMPFDEPYCRVKEAR